MNPDEAYQESIMICPGCFYQKISKKWDVLSVVAEMAWDVLSG